MYRKSLMNSNEQIDVKDEQDTINSISMSYSVFLDNIKDNQDEIRHRLPKKVNSWVDDGTVKSCYSCNKQFGLFLRKHHCRFCGRIFCYDCSNYQTHIPADLLPEDSKKGTWNEYLSSYVTKDTKDPIKYKVCKSCLELISTISSIKKTIEVFLTLHLDIKDLIKSSIICRLWKNASDYLISIFKNIQYKIPTDCYTEIERKLLWINSNNIVGHNRYLTHLLKICKNDDDIEQVKTLLNMKKKIPCSTLLCSRNCQERLSVYDAFNILCYTFNNKSDVSHKLRSIVLEYFICSDKQFKCFLPILVYYLRWDGDILGDFVINRCKESYNLLNSLYWELQMYPRDEYHEKLYSKIFNKLTNLFTEPKHEQQFVKILQGASFSKILDSVAKSICEDDKKYDEIKDNFNIKNDVNSPLNPNIKIKNININQIKIKNSATKPLIIPCETTESTTSVMNILYKRENVRKDQIIMNIMSLMDIILSKDEEYTSNMVLYNILPTGQSTGIIEVINDCETIYQIQEKLQKSILNYILDNNDNTPIKDVRQKFIKSIATYCVVTYLLGVGDRHLDNIMVTKDGKLFHIDFGYICGKDPVHNNPGIRITQDMIEAIGGINSPNYIVFTELCTKIYNCLRNYTELFMNMLMMLPQISDLKMSEKEIINLIVKRFMPGENIVDAKLHFVNQLEQQSYMDKIKDWCHYHSKEQTINSAVGKFTNVVQNIIANTVKNNN